MSWLSEHKNRLRNANNVLLTLKRLGYFGGIEDWGHHAPPRYLGSDLTDRRTILHGHRESRKEHKLIVILYVHFYFFNLRYNLCKLYAQIIF